MSDGFVDTPNPSRKSFGNKRFEKVIEAHMNETLAAQKKALEDALRDFQKHAEQRDDILVIGIKV